MEKLIYERADTTKEKIELPDDSYMLIKALENLTEAIILLREKLRNG